MQKTIAFSPPKTGKTVFGLTMFECGTIYIIDTEARVHHYTVPHPGVDPASFPFDNPRIPRLDNHMVQSNPVLKAAFEAGISKGHKIYLVQSIALDVIKDALYAFNRSPEIFGGVVDSSTVIWDYIMDLRDTSNDVGSGTDLKSWIGPKTYNRRMFHGFIASGKHVLVTAHPQEKLKLKELADGRREFVVDKVIPHVEKKVPHWADMVVAMEVPPKDPKHPDAPIFPRLRVVDEGLGGLGGLTRGARMENPTYKALIDRLGGLTTPLSVPNLDRDDAASAAVLDKIGSGPRIPNTDSKTPLGAIGHRTANKPRTP